MTTYDTFLMFGGAPPVSEAITLTAARPALVVRSLVEVGDDVSVGDTLLVTETMKCETPVLAPASGRVNRLAQVGSVVEVGEPLAELDGTPRVRRPPSIAEVLAAATAGGGRFDEYDLMTTIENDDLLVPVYRPPGAHRCGLVLGVLTHDDPGGPIRRVFLAGDPARAMGAVSEEECRRIIAAVDLAEEHGWPLEWSAVSAGAVISLASGTENMDWCAAVVARLVQFTQRGGEVIVITTGINVGAQSYWNAEATMLGHCVGMLVMVDGSAMVLTGRRALALAGGRSEADDLLLGGYQEVMGPNGEAHHRVSDLDSAFTLVRTHHRLARHRPTPDPSDRSVCDDPYRGEGAHSTVGDILDGALNPERKLPFSVRPLMASLVDRDSEHLERWGDQHGADGTVVWDCRIGGRPTTLVGIESHHRPPTSADDPEGGWSGGTLYPMSSKKVARAINTASGRRPVVVLANLAGFDGSRWSLERNQLEFGAEIARAVVNFRGRIVVVVVGRFHGGAYVVFNRRLNSNLVMLALDQTKVSVIGGSAAAEVLRADVRRLSAELQDLGNSHEDAEAMARRALAASFDEIHDVRRAHRTGSVDAIISADRLRPAVIEQLERRLGDDWFTSPAQPLASRSAGPA